MFLDWDVTFSPRIVSFPIISCILHFLTDPEVCLYHIKNSCLHTWILSEGPVPFLSVPTSVYTLLISGGVRVSHCVGNFLPLFVLLFKQFFAQVFNSSKSTLESFGQIPSRNTIGVSVETALNLHIDLEGAADILITSCWLHSC